MLNYIIKSTVRNKQNIFLIFIITFLLGSTVLFLTNYSIIQNNQNDILNKERHGKWQFSTNNEKTLEIYPAQKVGKTYTIDTINVSQAQVMLSSFDQNMFELANLKLIDGNIPRNQNEIILDYNLVPVFNLDYQLGSTLQVLGQMDEYTFTVVGFFESLDHRWIQNNHISQYPSLITTDLQSSELTLFGVVREKARLADMGPSWTLNSLSYPNLNFDRNPDEAKVEMERTQSLERQQEAMWLSTTLLSCLVIFNIVMILSFKNDKKIRQLKLSHVSRIQIILMLLVQALIYTILGAFALGLSIYFVDWLFNLWFYKEAVLFNQALLKKAFIILLTVLCGSTLLINLSNLFVPTFENHIQNTIEKLKWKTRLTHFLYIILFTFATYLMIQSAFNFYGITVNEYNQRLRASLENPNYIFTSYCEFIEDNRPCGFDKTQMNEMSLIHGVDVVEATNRTKVDFHTDSNQDHTISVYSAILEKESLGLLSQWQPIKNLESFINGQEIFLIRTRLLDSFKDILDLDKNGELQIDFYESIDNQSESTILIGDKRIKVSQLVRENEEKFNLFGSPLINDVLNLVEPYYFVIHENLANELNINKENYDFVLVRTNSQANYNDTDRLISQYGKPDTVTFENRRLVEELQLIPQRRQMESEGLNILYMFLILLGLLTNLVLIVTKNNHKNIGLRRLLGESKTSILNKDFLSKLKLFLISLILGLVVFLIDFFVIKYDKIIKGQEIQSDEATSRLNYWLSHSARIDSSSLLVFILSIIIFIVILYGITRFSYHLIFRESPLANLEERN